MNSDERVDVTPAHMRSLMPDWPDPEEDVFRRHQSELYRLMELNARQCNFSTHYSVSDTAVADSTILDRVYGRLIRWLSNPNDETRAFKLSASGKAPRSFVVSWDPVDTPSSVSAEEMNDSNSVANRRLRNHARHIVTDYDTNMLAERILAPPTNAAPQMWDTQPYTYTPQWDAVPPAFERQPASESSARARHAAAVAAAAAGIGSKPESLTSSSDVPESVSSEE